MEDENKVDSGESGRRRFLHKMLGFGAAAGAATLLLNQDKSLMPLAQAGSGYPTAVGIDDINYGMTETELDSSVSGSNSAAFMGKATATSGSTTGVYGWATGTSGQGVFGYGVTGVMGGSSHAGGIGVEGYSDFVGVYGESFGFVGVHGHGEVAGVWGTGSLSTSIPFIAQGASGQAHSLQEWRNSAGAALSIVDSSGRLGAGTTSPEASVHGNNSSGTGVKGTSNSSSYYGVEGNNPNGVGVKGSSGSTALPAVYGESSNFVGVHGHGAAVGVWGTGIGPASVPLVAQGASGQFSSLQEWRNFAGTPLNVMDCNGRLGIGTVDLSGMLHSVASSGTMKPMIAQGAASQTASLQEWQDNYGNALSVVDASGQFGVGTSAPVAPLHLYHNTPTMLKAEADGSTPCILSLDTYATGSTTSGAGFVGRHSRGSKASPTDVVVGDRLGFNIFGGYAGGAFRHVAGIEGVVDTGTVGTSSLPSAIRFLTTPDGSMSRQERMRIDGSGNVVPPSDNSGSIGTASKRWSNLYVVTLHQGDIQFENNFTVTEDERVGLAFKNDAGEKIAVLDRQGNLYVKGRVVEGLPR